MPADKPKQDPTVRAVRQVSRPDGGDAFLPDTVRYGADRFPITDAEEFGEEFVASATMGESVEMDAQNEVIEEEIGGPFVEVEGEEEEEAVNEAAPMKPAPRRVGNAGRA